MDDEALRQLRADRMPHRSPFEPYLDTRRVLH